MSQWAIESISEKQSSWRPTDLVREVAAWCPTETADDAETVVRWADDLAGQIAVARCVDISKPVPPNALLRRDGRPVTDLQPYLEAYGHLVALRDGDLAYLHVHPLGSPGDGTTAPGPAITFAAAVPSEGAYRLFLDFRHGDEVRTAEFTATTTGG